MKYKTTMKTAKRACVRFKFVRDTQVKGVLYKAGDIREIEIIKNNSIMWDYELLEALRKKEKTFLYHGTIVPLENVKVLGWKSYRKSFKYYEVLWVSSSFGDDKGSFVYGRNDDIKLITDLISRNWEYGERFAYMSTHRSLERAKKAAEQRDFSSFEGKTLDVVSAKHYLQDSLEPHFI